MINSWFWRFFMIFRKFWGFNSAKVPGIDREWFACVFVVLTIRSCSFPRSLSFKNLPNSPKVKNLTENPLLVLSRVSKFSDFPKLHWKNPDFRIFHDIAWPSSELVSCIVLSTHSYASLLDYDLLTPTPRRPHAPAGLFLVFVYLGGRWKKVRW